MVAEIGRYLHQPIDQVLEWSVEQFFLMHEQIGVLLEAERPKS